MTDTWPHKRCTGAHCDWRERCEHHALPTTDTHALVWPIKTAEYCDHFTPKSKAYGDGPDVDVD